MSIKDLESNEIRREREDSRKLNWFAEPKTPNFGFGHDLHGVRQSRQTAAREDNMSKGRIHATLDDDISTNIAEDVRTASILFRIVDVDSDEVLLHPTTDRTIVEEYLESLTEEEKSWIRLETARV